MPGITFVTNLDSGVGHRARFAQPKVRSTIHRLGSTMKPLTSRSVRLTTLILIRLASNTARAILLPA
jgi:hypothetical protein